MPARTPDHSAAIFFPRHKYGSGKVQLLKKRSVLAVNPAIMFQLGNMIIKLCQDLAANSAIPREGVMSNRAITMQAGPVITLTSNSRTSPGGHSEGLDICSRKKYSHYNQERDSADLDASTELKLQ